MQKASGLLPNVVGFTPQEYQEHEGYTRAAYHPYVASSPADVEAFSKAQARRQIREKPPSLQEGVAEYVSPEDRVRGGLRAQPTQSTDPSWSNMAKATDNLIRFETGASGFREGEKYSGKQLDPASEEYKYRLGIRAWSHAVLDRAEQEHSWFRKKFDDIFMPARYMIRHIKTDLTHNPREFIMSFTGGMMAGWLAASYFPAGSLVKWAAGLGARAMTEGTLRTALATKAVQDAGAAPKESVGENIQTALGGGVENVKLTAMINAAILGGKLVYRMPRRWAGVHPEAPQLAYYTSQATQAAADANAIVPYKPAPSAIVKARKLLPDNDLPDFKF